MSDADLELQHRHAHDNHDLIQRIKGIRVGAIHLRSSPTTGKIQEETVREISQWLMKEAARLEKDLT